jgi:nitrite reductase/ring-hydroxylating ferredoxin subunit
VTQWYDAAASDAVTEDAVLGCAVNGVPVAIFRVEGEVFALYDLCSHGHARLSDGYVEDDCVECPLHQGLVDIRTGKPRSAPISEPVRSIPAREVEGRIEVEL